jgi:hypothetical protein
LRIQTLALQFLFELLLTAHDMDRSILYPLFLVVLWLSDRPAMIKRYFLYSAEKQVFLMPPSNLMRTFMPF